MLSIQHTLFKYGLTYNIISSKNQFIPHTEGITIPLQFALHQNDACIHIAPDVRFGIVVHSCDFEIEKLQNLYIFIQ